MQPDPLTIGLILSTAILLCAALYYRGRAGAARVERDAARRQQESESARVTALSSDLETCKLMRDGNTEKVRDWMRRHGELNAANATLIADKNHLTGELVKANEAGTKEAARISVLENDRDALIDGKKKLRDLHENQASTIDELHKAHAATIEEKQAALDGLAEKDEKLRAVACKRDRYKRSAEEWQTKANRLTEAKAEAQSTIKTQTDLISARNQRIEELVSERNEYQQADSAKRTEIAKLKGHAGALESKLAALTTTRPTTKKPARRTAKKKTKR